MSESNDDNHYSYNSREERLRNSINHVRGIHLALTVCGVFLTAICIIVFGVWGMMTLSPILHPPVQPGYALFFGFFVQLFGAIIVIFTNSQYYFWLIGITDGVNLFLTTLNLVLMAIMLGREVENLSFNDGSINTILMALMCCLFEVLQLIICIMTASMIVNREKLHRSRHRPRKYHELKEITPSQGQTHLPNINIKGAGSFPLNGNFADLTLRTNNKL